MNEPDRTDEDFLRWLGATIVGVAVIAFVVAIAVGVEVPIRNAGGATLNATPQAVGNALARVDYYLHNDSTSTDAIVCGYDTATLSLTPGPTSGDKLSPGEGKHICTFADQTVYCRSAGASRVYFDESRMVTPTPTP